MIKLNKKILSLITVIIMSTSLLISCKEDIKISDSNDKKIQQESDIERESVEDSEFLKNINMDNALRNINYLSKEIGPRYAGDESEIKACEYIKSEFEKMGYTTTVQDFEFNAISESFSMVKKNSKNVQAIKKAKADSENTEIIYVTAHYDSVKVSPGANDNGSGVSAILEIANAMKDIETDKEIRFIAFGAEEEGLFGSKNYVANLTAGEISRSIGCFNLDMVATDYEANTELGVYTFDGKSNELTEEVERVGTELENLSTESVSYDGEFDSINGRGYGRSDHESFAEVNIPAVLFINIRPDEKNAFNSLEPYYHTPEDNMENFSKDRLERSIKLVGQAIYNMSKVNE